MSLVELFDREKSDGIQQKIVEELLNDNNLDTKTELSRPLRWACMKSVEGYIQDKKLKYSSSLLNTFMDISFHYLISKDRQGRKEYIEALQSLRSGDPDLDMSQPGRKISMIRGN